MFREMSVTRQVWAGGGLATQQDLSALFVVRSVELYLREGGRFGFVMPRAMLSRQQFRGFRTGDYLPGAKVHFEDEVWDLDQIEPSPFPVPSCVAFGTRSAEATAIAGGAVIWAGTLPGRNPSWQEASAHLSRTPVAGVVSAATELSPYSTSFAQGATFTPRLLVTVDDAPAGPLGAGAGRRSVTSARTSQEKVPWKDLPSLSGVVEDEFVRPVFFGVSVAPFRVLGSGLAVTPWSGERLLEATDDELDDHPGLARWWRQATAVWDAHRRNENLSLTGRLDFHHGLTNQFPLPQQRVVYTKAGTNLAAARVDLADAVIDHKLYWAAVESPDEAYYLLAILNSGEVKERVNPLQSRGQWGERDIDKYVFHVPFPKYEAFEAAHARLAQLGERAEQVAAAVDVAGAGYGVARRRIRTALANEGIAAEIDEAVRALLSP
jgi:hypothetical protein